MAVTVFALAASGARTAPSVGDELLRRSEAEAGGRNVVNVTIVDFRGFDTLGEITVLGVAAIGVLNLVGVARREQRRKRLRDGVDLGGADRCRRPPVRRRADRRDGTRGAGMSAEDRAGAGPPRESVRRSVILTTTANGLVPMLLLVSVYLTFRGHNAPGGGFAGGLVWRPRSRSATWPTDPGRSTVRARPGVRSSVWACWWRCSWPWRRCSSGASCCESAIWKVDVPVIGPVKVVSSAGFDIGVHLLVLGAVLAVVTAFVHADETSVVPDTAPDHPTWATLLLRSRRSTGERHPGRR